MFPKRVFRWFVASASLALVLSACAHKEVEPIELAPGEYDLVAVVAGSKPHLESRGRLALHADNAATQRSGDHPYRLYGSTNVDFIKLGAPIDTSATPSASTDPENPGVLVLIPPPSFKEARGKSIFNVSRPWDAPIMLIGTLENTKATRGWLDGGGIALYLQSKKRQCMKGEWSHWGLSIGNRGSFTLCPITK